MSAVLEARGIDVRRGVTPILHDVSLALHAGEALAIVGPNAAGKSTLVRALAGLLSPSAGEIRLEGRALASWPREQVARRLALVASEDDGPDLLTVADRVALGRYPHRGPFRPYTREDHAAVALALARTGIEPLASRLLGRLSAGERQLAALARGLAQQPRVLLLDEPAAHLDVGHQLQLFRVLDEARSSGVAVLAVVHDLQRAAAWADRAALVAGGRLTLQGAPADVIGSEDCARAFGVRVQAHPVAGLGHPLYTFEEPTAGD